MAVLEILKQKLQNKNPNVEKSISLIALENDILNKINQFSEEIDSSRDETINLLLSTFFELYSSGISTVNTINNNHKQPTQSESSDTTNIIKPLKYDEIPLNTRIKHLATLQDESFVTGQSPETLASILNISMEALEIYQTQVAYTHRSNRERGLSELSRNELFERVDMIKSLAPMSKKRRNTFTKAFFLTKEFVEDLYQEYEYSHSDSKVTIMDHDTEAWADIIKSSHLLYTLTDLTVKDIENIYNTSPIATKYIYKNAKNAVPGHEDSFKAKPEKTQILIDMFLESARQNMNIEQICKKLKVKIDRLAVLIPLAFNNDDDTCQFIIKHDEHIKNIAKKILLLKKEEIYSDNDIISQLAISDALYSKLLNNIHVL